MIFTNLPNDWKDLQDRVALVLEQCGFKVESPKDLRSARSEIIEVDVYAVDESSILQQTVVCECKYWNKKVPQSVVHSFRAQIEDIGANIGLLISKNGFQSGAHDASKYSNIKLLTWEEFEKMFLPIWYKTYFLKKASLIGERLTDYTEPVNTGTFKRVEFLSEEGKSKFKVLRDEYLYLGTLCSFLYSDYYKCSNKSIDSIIKYCLPFDKYINAEYISFYPEEMVNATSYFELLLALEKNVVLALNKFDELFKGI